jgi:hypothetical protein
MDWKKIRRRLIKIFVFLVVLIITGYFALAMLFAFTDWYRDNNSRWTTTAEGPSMYPTIKSGQPFELDRYNIPKEGDIISFSCFSKCNREDFKTASGEMILTKRLIKINDDCYWVEGDNKEESFDSRDFGWICKNQDIRVNGVVTKIGDEVLIPKTSFLSALINVVKHTF